MLMKIKYKSKNKRKKTITLDLSMSTSIYVAKMLLNIELYKKNLKGILIDMDFDMVKSMKLASIQVLDKGEKTKLCLDDAFALLDSLELRTKKKKNEYIRISPRKKNK